MDLHTIGSCANCYKKNVCKYQEQRNNLEYDIEEKVVSGVYDIEENPFSIECSCKEWGNGVKDNNFR